MFRRLLLQAWLLAPAALAAVPTLSTLAEGADSPAATTQTANVAPAQVREVLRGDGRVYVRVEEGAWDFWVMAPHTQVQPGAFVLLGKGPLRRGFTSAQLDRTFDEIIELPAVTVVDEQTATASLRVEPVPGGRTVAQVYAQRQTLSQQTVRVRGRIAKANKGIFGKNWYHLQDGTGDPDQGTHDLTITTQADLEVGDIAIAEGTLTINKDLGFGYFYAAIVEDGSLVAAD